STESRSTPGMEATGSRFFSPSTRNSGQMKSEADSEFSATSLRVHSWRRNRRMRVAGKDGVMLAVLPSCRRLCKRPLQDHRVKWILPGGTGGWTMKRLAMAAVLFLLPAGALAGTDY